MHTFILCGTSPAGLFEHFFENCTVELQSRFQGIRDVNTSIVLGQQRQFKGETSIQLVIGGILADFSPSSKISVQIVGARPVKHLKARRQIHEALLS